jgi:tetratricopeptide (TPR) repeat protein
MVACSSCKTRNTLDSRFCRSCGDPLDAAALADAKSEAAETVAEGQRLFGAGRNAEAKALAAQVVADDPANVAALALLGDCLEREGFFAEALDCYERLVVLNPDSALDRIRLAQIRRRVQGGARNARLGDDRRMAVLAAVAAGVLLFSAGSALVLATRPQAQAAYEESGSASAAPFTGPSPVPLSGNQGNPATQPPAAEEPSGSAEPANAGSQPAPGGVVVRRDSRPVGATSLRNPTGRPALPDSGSYRPIDPFTVTPENLPRETGSPTVARTAPDEPKPVQDEPPAAQEGRRAVVDVRPSQGNSRAVGGSSTVDRDQANEVETLLRVGRQHQVGGDHRQAAAAYERALARGADPATTQQRLGQVYEKQGRKAEAASAYRRAAAAFEQKLKDGKGDRKLLESQAEACREAAKLLGG